MNKIFLETKISIEGSLNLKNLSQINNPDFSIDEFKKIKVLYKNKQKNLNEIFKIKIIKSKKHTYFIHFLIFCFYQNFRLKIFL